MISDSDLQLILKSLLTEIEVVSERTSVTLAILKDKILVSELDELRILENKDKAAEGRFQAIREKIDACQGKVRSSSS